MLKDMDAIFAFQPTEGSVSVYVALLLFTALKGHDVKILPYVNLDVPFKKKGHPYQSDFIIFDVPANVLITKFDNPIMLVEIKKGISVNFNTLDHHDVMELFIYCLYVTRIYKVDDIIGSLTDGQTWHTFKIEKVQDSLSILKHLVLSSTDKKIILGTVWTCDFFLLL